MLLSLLALASLASAASQGDFERLVQARVERLRAELGPSIAGIRNPYPTSWDNECWETPTARLQAYGVYERQRLLAERHESTLQSRRAVLARMEELSNLSGSDRVFKANLGHEIAGLEKALLEAQLQQEAAARLLVADGHALRNAKGELQFLLQGPDDGLKGRACAPVLPQVIEVR